MIPVEQRIPHNPPEVFGDCWKACIASLLEFPYEAVPHFGDFNKIAWPTFQIWLSLLNLKAQYWTILDEPVGNYFPEGYSIAIGPSPRFPEMNHCCIALDGKVVFDPHPDKTGLNTITRFETIVPIEDET